MTTSTKAAKAAKAVKPAAAPKATKEQFLTTWLSVTQETAKSALKRADALGAQQSSVTSEDEKESLRIAKLNAECKARSAGILSELSEQNQALAVALKIDVNKFIKRESVKQFIVNCAAINAKDKTELCKSRLGLWSFIALKQPKTMTLAAIQREFNHSTQAQADHFKRYALETGIASAFNSDTRELTFNYSNQFVKKLLSLFD